MWDSTTTVAADVYILYISDTLTNSSRGLTPRPAHTNLSVRFPTMKYDGDYVEKHDVGPSLFTLLQLEVLTEGVRTRWCDQPLEL